MRPRAAAVPLQRPRHALLPSARSVLVGLAIAAAACLAYVAARESSLFAVRTFAVTGGSPALDAKVRSALAPLAGASLIGLHGDDVVQLATAVPQVAAVSYDRAFPHTLRITVRAEQPLAVLREGHDAWLVSRSGRMIAKLSSARTLPTLPRIWEPRSVAVALGGTLAAGAGAEEVAALTPVGLTGLRGRVLTVRREGGTFTYVLRGGGEVHAGSRAALPLKLAIAARILAAEPALQWLDVSVPQRPVGGTNPQVSGRG
jgi:cell division protein FtsQ